MNAIKVKGTITAITHRTFEGRTVVNVRLHDVVENEHRLYYDIAFWGSDSKQVTNFNENDTVLVEGKLKVKPYTGKDGSKSLRLIIYDIKHFDDAKPKSVCIPDDHRSDADRIGYDFRTCQP